MDLNLTSILKGLFIILIGHGLIACGPGADSKEDNTKPLITLASLNTGEEIIGTYTIKWNTDEANRSTVDIHLSRDSGASYPEVIGLGLPDTGSYNWDSNTVKDCRTCRIRITPRDVVGNVGEPIESAMDFIINNVPQVYGVALYYDTGNDGPGLDDTVVIPFDKEIDIREPISRDLQLRVLGDSFGNNATVKLGPANSQLTVTLGSTTPENPAHLHVGGTYTPNRIHKTAPSGIDIIENLPPGTITAKDTGRTAEPSGGVDIASTFGSSGQTFGGGDNCLAFGDVDGDGDHDLVTGVRGANKVWININGVFTYLGQALGSNNTNSIVLGDIDSDGDLDLVTGNGGANHVWINNNGLFTDSGQTLGTSSTRSVVLGDVDGDGDLDLVAGNIGANRVWINNNGLFTDAGQALGNSDTTTVILGDVDGDKDLDLITGNWGEANRIWLNNKGEFIDSGQILGTSRTNSIDMGDVDGDGDLDIVTGNEGDNILWLNNIDKVAGQEGIFTDSGQVLGTSETISIVLGDVDSDGDLDIVTGNSLRQANRVWINNFNQTQGQKGLFTDSGQLLGEDDTYSVIMGDVDGDRDLDIIESTYTGNHIWLNSQRTTSAEPLIDSGQILGDSHTTSVALGDIDGDGDLDLVTGNRNYLNSSAANYVWFNNINGISGQDGVFTDSGQALGNSSTSSIAIGDIDGDGDLDLVTGNRNYGQFSAANHVWINNINNIKGQEGIFSDSGQPIGNSDTRSVALGDVDGDGDLDLVTGNDGANRVWINNDGKYDLGQEMGNYNTWSVSLGDIDGDEDLDLITGNSGANRIWLNHKGKYTESDQQLGGSTTWPIALGDVDGDGDLDLVTGNNGADLVWLNNINNIPGEKGRFTDSGQALGNSLFSIVALGDVDNDGDLDLATGNGEYDNRLWINNIINVSGQNGKFTNSGQFPGAQITISIILGDVDGDGDMDLVMGKSDTDPANPANPTNRVFLSDY